jgi:hypothetical protein
MKHGFVAGRLFAGCVYSYKGSLKQTIKIGDPRIRLAKVDRDVDMVGVSVRIEIEEYI